MVTYEVTTVVDPRLIEDNERYMRQVHIPALLTTGCFHSASLTRSAVGRYRIRYEAATETDLERYLTTHAAQLREEFTARLRDGITASREFWVAIETWDRQR
jgi:hypothetical protein